VAVVVVATAGYWWTHRDRNRAIATDTATGSRVEAKPFNGQSYRTQDGRSAITLISSEELEYRVSDGTTLLCKYTSQQDAIRVIMTALGTQQVLYFRRVPNGLISNDGIVYMSSSALLEVQRAEDYAKRTAADMRSLATAWEALATDYNCYNPGTGSLGPSSALSPSQRLAELSSQISPTYIRNTPQRDGWGGEFLVFTDDASAGHAQVYMIVSAGADGQFERNWSEFFSSGSSSGETLSQQLNKLRAGPTNDPSRDIVYSMGTWVRGPKWLQSLRK
jgi:hypothetical protein